MMILMVAMPMVMTIIIINYGNANNERNDDQYYQCS